MGFSFGNRLKHAWNAFINGDSSMRYSNYGYSSGYRMDRPRFSRGVDRTIISSVYNRIALDVSQITIQHVKTDKDGRYKETIDSKLNECLTLEANIDQTARDFIQDLVLTMFDEGCAAIVPVDTSDDIIRTGSFDVLSMRVGKIVEWFPRAVRVNVYNDRSGEREEIILPKERVVIVDNPFYCVMNESNSVVQRIIQKFRLLDAVDEYSSSGKLDLIIQLPYVIKTKAREDQAELRRKLIENQLANSKYGIAYIDGTEHITQLNRSLENNFLTQIQYLVDLFYSQMGITSEVMNSTADEKTMLNYNTRTIEPIVSAIADNIKRKFLTKTARSQGQSIMFFKDPFKLVPVSDLAEIADKMTRNEIMTSNELRQIIGMKPSSDPSADELRNKNLSQPAENKQPSNVQKLIDKVSAEESKEGEEESSQNG